MKLSAVLREKLNDVSKLLPHTQGNQIITTTEMYHLFKDAKILLVRDRLNYMVSLNSVSPRYGILQRYAQGDPRNEEQLDQHDNYMAACTATGIDKSLKRYPRAFFLKGLTTCFHYANIKPKTFREWFSCFMQPYQVGIMILCSGWILPILTLPLGILCYIHLWGAILIEAYRTNGVSGKKLTWSLYHAYIPYRFIIAIPLMIFKRQVIKQFGSFNGFFPEYYGPDCGIPEIAKYAIGERDV